MKNLLWYLILVNILFVNSQETGAQEMGLKLTSSAFTHNQSIPRQFTCQGKDVNPELKIEEIPLGTKSLALIVDDPDAPGKVWVHWIVFNIAPTTIQIAENTIPGKQGINDFGKIHFGGPCPPSGTHRYFFKLYALDKMLDLQEGIKKIDLEKAMAGHILGQAELLGLYKKD